MDDSFSSCLQSWILLVKSWILQLFGLCALYFFKMHVTDYMIVKFSVIHSIEHSEILETF